MRRFLLLLTLLTLCPRQVEAQPVDLTEWLNNQILDLLKTKIDLRDPSRQTENPSNGENSMTLVDPASSAALIGLALNLVDPPADSEDGDNSAVAVTLNAYSFLAAFKGEDPLDPGFYNEHEKWRALSFTLGYDDELVAEDSEETERAQLLGIKYMLLDRRQPSKQKDELNRIQAQLTGTTRAYAILEDEVKAFFLSQPAVTSRLGPDYRHFLQSSPVLKAEVAQGVAAAPFLTDLTAQPARDWRTEERIFYDQFNHLFTNTPDRSQIEPEYEKFLTAYLIDQRVTAAPFLSDPTAPATKGWSTEELTFYVTFKNGLFTNGFAGALTGLDAASLEELKQIVEQGIDSFVLLEEQTQDALAAIQGAPQLSLALSSQQRPEGADEYSGELIYDQGIGGRFHLTLNGSYEYKDSKGQEEDTHSERLAAQLSFEANPRTRLVGRDPFRASLSIEGKRMSEDDVLRAQAKLVIPILDGVDLPLSLTYANRTELIDEEDVRGHLGFTLDIARLVDGLRVR